MLCKYCANLFGYFCWGCFRNGMLAWMLIFGGNLTVGLSHFAEIGLGHLYFLLNPFPQKISSDLKFIGFSLTARFLFTLSSILVLFVLQSVLRGWLCKSFLSFLPLASSWAVTLLPVCAAVAQQGWSLPPWLLKHFLLQSSCVVFYLPNLLLQTFSYLHGYFSHFPLLLFPLEYLFLSCPPFHSKATFQNSCKLLSVYGP